MFQYVLRKAVYTLLAIPLLLQLQSCQFALLKDDLEQLAKTVRILPGQVTLSDSAIKAPVLLVKYSKNSEQYEVNAFESLANDLRFLVPLRNTDTYLIAVADENRNGRYDHGEPYGYYGEPSPLNLASKATDITIALNQKAPLADSFVAQILSFEVTDLVTLGATQLGEKKSLDQLNIGLEGAKLGVWQPYKFMQEKQLGIFLLQDYDPKKIPVIFVHGMQGFPEQFEQYIESLNSERYQPWVFVYPSGIRLDIVSYFLHNRLKWLHESLGFHELHIVAHSMGGLISRGALLKCGQQCSYQGSLTSVASPWGGVKSANAGVERAPEVVPSWIDLQTDGDYIKKLSSHQLPDNFRFYLAFTYKATKIRIENSDNSVALVSQLANYVQQQADEQRGFYETHTSVLNSDSVMQWWHSHQN